MRILLFKTTLMNCSTILMLLFTPGNSAAIPIQFSETGHSYDFIWAGEITWTEANREASLSEYLGHQGYLATITSQGENAFLYQTFGHIFWEGWLGGWQDLNSSPSANWHWVTGELWDYTNWAGGEPNDGAGTGEERYLQMWGFGTIAPGRWNDDANDTNLGNIGGFLVEYDDALAPIPEPATLTLSALGLGIAACRQYWRKRRQSL